MTQAATNTNGSSNGTPNGVAAGGMPRAMRWALVGGGAIALYFLAFEPALVQYNTWRNRGDAAESILSRYEAAGESVRRAGETLTRGVRVYGEVAFPGDPETRPLEFDRAVDAVLERHDITGHTSTTRTAPLGNGPLLTRVGPTHRVERLTKTVDFRARPDAIVAVLADLEATPVVSTVSSVQVRHVDSKESPGEVNATLTIESWMLVKKDRPR